MSLCCRSWFLTTRKAAGSRQLLYVQDSVTPAGQARQISVGLAVLVAILILLPMAPETTDSISSMPPSMYL